MTKTPEVCANCVLSIYSEGILYCVLDDPVEVEPDGGCGNFMGYVELGDISDQSGALS